MLSYRPDIDGLRAVAVLSVLFFHLDIDLFKGGFVGVDIFFVISGFLITSILLKDIHAGRFSLAEFYERRARRILPALVIVCAVSVGIFGVALFPDDYAELGKSIAAAMLSISNIYFWSIIDYFAATSDKPMLHTWSLGVEEQFYIFFPLLLFGVSFLKDQKKQLLILVSIILTSLIFSAVAVSKFPSFAFYMLPSRFWELGIGALLAFKPTVHLTQKRLEILHISGFSALLASIFLFDDDMPFPGLAALLPCLGVAAIILNGNAPTKIQTFLSKKPVVFIGLISYSLYLWHWPLIGFSRLYFGDAFTILNKVIVIAVTVLFAVLTWKFIETPFRNRAFLTRRCVFGLSLFAMIALTACGGIIAHYKGFPSPFTTRALEIATVGDEKNQQQAFNVCLDPTEEQKSFCSYGSAKAKGPTVLIWGDSHATALAPVISDLMKEYGRKATPMSQQSCPGLIGDYKIKGSGFAACREFNEKVFAYLKAHPEIKTVIFAARWAPFAKKLYFENEQTETSFYNALSHTALILRSMGIQPLFIAATPETGFTVPSCLARREAFGSALSPCTPTSRKAYEERQKETRPAFEKLAETYPVVFPADMLCNDKTCPVMMDGDVLYFDDDHVSAAGARKLLPLLKERFGQALKQ